MESKVLVAIVVTLLRHLGAVSADNEGVVTFGLNDVVQGLQHALDDGHLTVREFVDLCAGVLELDLFD